MQPETFKRPRLLASSVYLLSSAMFSTSNALVNILDSIKMTPVVSSFPSEKCGYIIGTHDGTFHCDECLAIGMLKTLPEFAKSTIIRTRKMDLLNQCDIVVDVGSEYNAESNRLDHHQREFSRTFPSHSTRLSSAGLVFEKFGKSIISNLAPKLATYDFQISDEIVDVIHKRLYRQFVEHVDAIDNGVSIAENPRYHISTSLSSRVGMLNPGWNEDQSTDALNNRFSSAVMLTCSEFVSHLDGMINQWLPARDIIVTAIANRFSVHESGKIIRLEKACPWKDHLYQIENELKISGEILYALYNDGTGMWRIQAVPDSDNSFVSRKALPEAWRGIRDAELSQKVGIEGCSFVHASGFIGGHSNYEGAVQMATKALN